MTSTTLGHKKCLDKWGAVQYSLDKEGTFAKRVHLKLG